MNKNYYSDVHISIIIITDIYKNHYAHFRISHQSVGKSLTIKIMVQYCALVKILKMLCV